MSNSIIFGTTNLITLLLLLPGERVLFTSPYLYGVDSDIIRVLTHQSPDIILDTRTSEHLKFLADISLQLSDTQRLCVALDRPDDVGYDTFTILGNWVASQGGAASLTRLKEKLSTIDIVNIAVCENKDSSDLLSPHLEDCLILDIFTKDLLAPSYKAMLDLSIKLQNCWKNVGRLLGILPRVLDELEKSSNIIDPLSYQLIYNWQRGEELRLGHSSRPFIECSTINHCWSMMLITSVYIMFMNIYPSLYM